MITVFCQDPLRPRQVDEVYRLEADTITALGLKYTVINYESLVNDNNPVLALKYVSTEERPILGIYRGWMLRPNQYAKLYVALSEKGIQLINSPQAYRYCHYLPESYSAIESYTPQSVWLPVSGDVEIDEVMALLSPFGSRSIIVKDFVKSQKHYWSEACFIPSAADCEAVKRVVNRFLELQGDSLNEGLVFREFIKFESLTDHSQSGMPLSKEFRVFVLDGEPFYAIEYWEEGDYQGLSPPTEQFAEVMGQIKSRFFTMDIAKRNDGEWAIVELGDAQVAGLPHKADVRKFYKILTERLLARLGN